jgi:hypothetical protein
MEILNLKKIYINGNHYFYDMFINTNEFNKPMLYKDEVFIGVELFDIYSEIYRN